eukprot:2398538-Amphidinium_carterae.2
MGKRHPFVALGAVKKDANLQDPSGIPSLCLDSMKAKSKVSSKAPAPCHQGFPHRGDISLLAAAGNPSSSPILQRFSVRRSSRRVRPQKEGQSKKVTTPVSARRLFKSVKC